MAQSINSQNADETELTMCDVLEEEQEMEDDANAVLGGSDDTNCSYEKGYVPRQALYACLTCSVDQEPSGVCLACSYKCHDGHEIVELYTKRNFRCDCGNSKFSGKTCSLKPEKEPVNHLNKYNQNFKGLYCSCSRPYPDMEDNTPDEMIQCIMCEDWYHGRHIGGVVPEDYAEMICSKCMESHTFLYSYLNKFHYVNVDEKEGEEKCNGILLNVASSSDGVTTPSSKEDTKKDETDALSSDQLCQKDMPNVKREVKLGQENAQDVKGEIKVKSEQESVKDIEDDIVKDVKYEIKVKPVQENTNCLLKKLTIKPDGIMSGSAFWPENWRKELCQCSSCMDVYCKHNCEYLINVEDTILAYEERGQSTNESQYDRGLNALNQLDRVNQMEAVRAYTNMKGQLKEYLKEFANSKRTVCESDIKEFFDRMNSKRQRLNNGVPHFCR